MSEQTSKNASVKGKTATAKPKITSDIDDKKLKSILNDLIDPTYAKFNARLLPPDAESLGVKLPLLRHLAKQIAKLHGLPGWRLPALDSHEERMIAGFCIAYAKRVTTADRIAALDAWLPHANTWALTDCVASTLKYSQIDAPENQPVYKAWALSHLQSTHPYTVRFAVLVLWKYFGDSMGGELLVRHFAKVGSDVYIVKMAIAWGISMLALHDEATVSACVDVRIDREIASMAAQKIRDSRQFSKEEKLRYSEMLSGT